jgi:hypothetical protein
VSKIIRCRSYDSDFKIVVIKHTEETNNCKAEKNTPEAIIQRWELHKQEI